MYLFVGSKCLRVIAMATLLVTCAFAQTQDGAATVKDFQERVSKYVALKNEQNLPKTRTNSPDKLVQQKQQATEKIQSARPAAQQGDIFTPEVAKYFKKQIESTLRGTDGQKVRSSLRHAEPLPNVHLEANGKYPKNLPLQSTPPTLLMNLPPLPKELQYRVVGSSLVLYDEASNLVVDFIPNAIE
jgi:hypothetical protein